MSLKLYNGVTLPDIPTNVLEQFPYVVVFGPLQRNGDYDILDERYFFFANKTGYVYLPEELFKFNEIISKDGELYIDDVNSTAYYTSVMLPDYMDKWTHWNDYPYTYNADIWGHSTRTNIGFEGNDALDIFDVVWTNHNIYIATDYDSSTRIPTVGNEIYYSSYLRNTIPEVTDKNKFLGVAGLERLIVNTRSLIDAILPSGGITGQVLTIDSDGKPIWANYTGNTSLSVAEEVES